jgi:sigma-B regulation protein RsbU (phosphoserine phosphatase)
MDLNNQLPCALLVTDSTGQILEVNHELLALVGHTAAQWRDQSMAELLTPASRIFLQTHVWPMLLQNGRINEIYLHLSDAAKQQTPVMVNCQQQDGDGGVGVRYFWVIFVAKERSRYEAELLLARTQAQRISTHLEQANAELKVLHQQLEQHSVVIQSENRELADLSRTDALTGLSNRRALDIVVSRWRGLAPTGACAALLMVDVDHFKAVNDLHGHGEGDKVLCALAEQLRLSMRSSDLAVRYGGEEFVMWLPLADRAGAGQAAQRVHDNVKKVQVAGKSVTVSIGVATAHNTPDLDLLQLLTLGADKALYEAKAAGRNRTVHFN